MNDEQQAALSIKKFLLLLKGLGELAPSLDSLGSVKQAEQEVKSRISGLQIDETSLRNKVGQLRAEISELEKKAVASKALAKSDAESEIVSSRAEAKKLIERAQTEVRDIYFRANERLKETQAKVAEGEDRISLLNGEAKAAEARFGEAQRSLDAIVKRVRG